MNGVLTLVALLCGALLCSSECPNGCRACAKKNPGTLLATANLRTGDVSLTSTGNSYVVNQGMADPTPSDKTNCDMQGLLKITVPDGYVIRFDLNHQTPYSGFATFNVGDSQYNDGYSGNCEYHAPLPASSGYSNDCAEMHSIVEDSNNANMLFFTSYMPGWDDWTTQMQYLPPAGVAPWLLLNSVSRVLGANTTLWAGHQYMAANNNNKDYGNFQVCYDNDYVFLPKWNSVYGNVKSPNNDIYFGMNRVISGRSDRAGAGLCRASVYLIPCSATTTTTTTTTPKTTTRRRNLG